jgi:hypothetical protein
MCDVQIYAGDLQLENSAYVTADYGGPDLLEAWDAEIVSVTCRSGCIDSG